MNKVNIETTNVCNAKCIMCPHKNMYRPQGFMQLSLLDKILDELPSDVIEICLSLFGEPLLDERMALIIETVRSKTDAKLLLFTNGSHFGSWINPSIYSCIDEIVINFQGWESMIYEKNMGLSFYDTYNTIKDFLDKKPARLKAKVIMLDTGYTEEEKGKFKSLFNSISQVLPARNWGTYQTKEDGYRIPCGRPLSFNILWDGRVVLCCRDYDATVVLGDLNKSTIHDIWETKVYKTIRDTFKRGEKPFEICKTCYPV